MRNDGADTAREKKVFGRKKRRINRVLIVEDEPLVAFDTEHFLSDEGFEIHATVDRVATAIAHLESGNDAIDLVLVDVRLADGSGIEVAEAAHARGVAALFVTGDCPGEARFGSRFRAPGYRHGEARPAFGG